MRLNVADRCVEFSTPAAVLELCQLGGQRWLLSIRVSRVLVLHLCNQQLHKLLRRGRGCTAARAVGAGIAAGVVYR